MICSTLLGKIAWMQLMLSHKIRRFLLGPVSGSIPRSFIRSIEESSSSEEIQAHLHSIHPVLSAQVIDYRLPQTFPDWFRRQKAFDTKNIYIMRNVVVSPRSGLIWTDRGVLFGESIGDLFRLLDWGACLHEPLIPFDTLPIKEPVVCCPDALYYHWLLEWLPNLLYALDLFPELKIIICKKSPSFAHEALKLILGEPGYEEKVLIRNNRSPVYVSQAALPALTDWSGYVRPEDIVCIRKSFSSVLGRVDHSHPAHIYISRAHAARRQLPHEEEIENLLFNQGFEIIHGEEMSFQEQIETFARAEIIVAPHGAGLSNMIWRTGKCRIVEIFTPDWLNDCYARLSSLLGFEYHYHMLQENALACDTVNSVLATLKSDGTNCSPGAPLEHL